MKIGLVDVDGHNFPNLPLMKLSAWHKAHGDTVEWYSPLISGHMDIVYLAKVFSFSKDFMWAIDADKVVRGGSGYCIETKDGVEIYHKECDTQLPYEIEHIYPDYSIYGVSDTAYGFLTRGCPRGCGFCHVAAKEGKRSYKVANLDEFWRGQKNIVLLDPNILACQEWKDLLQQLADSGAMVDFTQGLDIRLMTKEKADMLNLLRIKMVHFAWDRFRDGEVIVPKIKEFMATTGLDRHKVTVYTLCNFDTTLEQDLERIYTLRDLNCQPYVMLYNKERLSKGSTYRHLQRWCNSPAIFARVKRFEDYKAVCNGRI